MSNLFKMFGTSKALEKDGVWVNYGEVKFLVARAGGANTRFSESLKAKIRPIKHQIDRDLLPREEDERLSAEIYAETVIKDVQIKQPDGTWKSGVPVEGGEPLPVTTENVVALLLELPEMFRDLKQCANDSNKFLKDQEEADTKNSKKS